MFAFNNARGFVHCQSEDGHSELEPVANICCNADNTDASPHITADSSEKTFFTKREGCGPCVDTIISFDVININKKTIPLNSTIAAVPAIFHINTDCYRHSGYVLSSVLPALVNPSLPSIRTIVLLA
jgi:hypothetical protein